MEKTTPNRTSTSPETRKKVPAVPDYTRICILPEDEEGKITVYSPPHPLLAAAAGALGSHFPAEAWVFPEERHDEVRELYGTLFFRDPDSVDLEVKVTEEGIESVRRLSGPELVELQASGATVEPLGSGPEAVAWLEGRLVEQMKVLDAMDSLYRKLLGR